MFMLYCSVGTNSYLVTIKLFTLRNSDGCDQVSVLLQQGLISQNHVCECFIIIAGVLKGNSIIKTWLNAHPSGGAVQFISCQALYCHSWRKLHFSCRSCCNKTNVSFQTITTHTHTHIQVCKMISLWKSLILCAEAHRCRRDDSSMPAEQSQSWSAELLYLHKNKQISVLKPKDTTVN